MHKETFEVTGEYEEERLDKFLAAIYPEQSRSFFQKLIKDGLVLVNDVPIKSKLSDAYRRYGFCDHTRCGKDNHFTRSYSIRHLV